ncbi:hypothetical protein GcC1_097016 [Golovinomyces cichoracearum]|uniref:Uncharacterized protein n=1 Tax=Golovinomyces cichoracearum TaxID=62708 RepID=A0A420IAX8_9PEZI|nr:hypothetical protein GcC1_097016 [Golovinomyces cichoracearum]
MPGFNGNSLSHNTQRIYQSPRLRPSSSSSQISEIRPDRSSQPWRPQKQDDADITLEQLHGLVLSDDQEVTNESKTCELGLQFNSLSSSGPSKKRQRVELEDLLNKTTAVPTEPPNFQKNQSESKQVKRGKKALKHLREIVGRAGEGPVDYVEFAKRINFPVNLLEFWQISTDGAKEFRRLSTRVNEKKSSKKATGLFSSSVNNADSGNNSYTSLMSVEQMAFRIPVVLAIQGPTLLQSNTHKLILYPKTAESSNFPLPEHLIPHESVQSSDTDSEASDDTDSSSFDDELPKNMSETVENPDVLNGKHTNKAEYISTAAEN